MKRKERPPGKPHRPSPATGGEFTVRAAFKAAVEHYQADRRRQKRPAGCPGRSLGSVRYGQYQENYQALFHSMVLRDTTSGTLAV